MLDVTVQKTARCGKHVTGLHSATAGCPWRNVRAQLHLVVDRLASFRRLWPCASLQTAVHGEADGTRRMLRLPPGESLSLVLVDVLLSRD